jgi:hypothetical protein
MTGHMSWYMRIRSRRRGARCRIGEEEVWNLRLNML